MPGRIELAGAQALDLVGATSFAREIVGGQGPTELVWQTNGNVSVPLEVVIQVENISGGLSAFNMNDRLRWQVFTWGHGEQSYELAPTPAQQAAGGAGIIRAPVWPITSRGVVSRLQARSVKIAIINTEPNSAAFIRASINPLTAPDSDRWPFPSSDYQPAGARCFFPIGAREWRLQPAGIDDLVDIYGFAANEAAAPAAFLFTRPVTDFWDWRLIAHREYSWIVSANGVAAQYR